ncbi:MAG: winged helix-turn-helix domain-containing protein [Jatrophihabitantaceae bacterium]
MSTDRPKRSVADIAPIAALFADRTRARIVGALVDGRSLPASVLAQESGVSASTTSEHLSRLVDGGVLAVEQSGRHRYFRLANADVAAAVEALAVIAPQPPVTSLRQSTTSAAVRRARTCYDHLAGRLGVAVTESLLARDALVRIDGVPGTGRADGDRLAAGLREHPYQLGPSAAGVFGELGVDVDALEHRPRTRRPMLRFCVDWSEQRHHLAGGLGAELLRAMVAADWVRRSTSRRAVELTEDGSIALHAHLGIVGGDLRQSA